MFRRGLRVSDAALWHRQCQISQFGLYAAQDVHCDKLHTLEGECSLDKHRKDTKESVKTNVFGLQTCTVEWTRVLPVLE